MFYLMHLAFFGFLLSASAAFAETEEKKSKGRVSIKDNTGAKETDSESSLEKIKKELKSQKIYCPSCSVKP